MSNSLPTPSNLQRVLPAMSAIFVDSMSFALITPMIVAVFSTPEFVANIPAGREELLLGLTFALFPLGMFFGSAMLGDISDHWGRKRTLMFCMAGLLTAFLLMAVAVASNMPLLLIAGRLLAGFMSGTTGIGTASILDLSEDDEKAGNIAKITFANVGAHLLGPALGGMLADVHIQWPFVMISLFAIASFIWMARGLKETFTPSEAPMDWMRPLRCFGDVFTHKALRRVSLVQLLTQLGNCMCYQFFFLYLATKMDYTAGELGWFGACALGLPAGLMLCGGTEKLQKHFTEKQLLTWNLTATALCAWAFFLVPGHALKWLVVFCWTTAFITCYVSLLKVFSDSASAEKQGWALGLASSIFALGFFFGGLTASLQSWLTLEALLFLGGLSMGLGAVASNALLPGKTRSE